MAGRCADGNGDVVQRGRKVVGTLDWPAEPTPPDEAELKDSTQPQANYLAYSADGRFLVASRTTFLGARWRAETFVWSLAPGVAPRRLSRLDVPEVADLWPRVVARHEVITAAQAAVDAAQAAAAAEPA